MGLIFGDSPMARLSAQQTAAIAALTRPGSIVVEAVAGAGKTSTLIEMLKGADGTVAFCAFNKSISQEIEYKISPLNLPNVKVGTLHSFGFGAIRRTVSNVKVDANKLRTLARQEFTGEYENLQQFVVSAAALAKECGIAAVIDNSVENWIAMFDHHSLWDSIPDGVTESTAIDASQYLLKCSNDVKNFIDFSDMIYMPILHKMKIWQYDNIFLDEAQDTNVTRRQLVKMMLKPQGRLVAVGDPHQAIYGFTGADSASLDNIKAEFNAVTLPLSVTFRCPKAIVKVANRWVSHIEAAESAPEGVVDSCEIQDLINLAGPQDAIICRNTKPLIGVAYKMIRNSIPCKVEGRAIGEGLVNLAMRWKRIKTVGELATKVEEWSQNEIEKHRAKGNDSRCQVIEDQAETLQVFIDQCEDFDTISVLVGKIRTLFSDTKEGEMQEILTLSTVHKSKGREWNRVFALGMDRYSPSKWAKQSWEMEQEDNLCYVQVTRAKQHLTLVNVPAKE
jgi:superfamily I DNA/RNA helicase